MAGRRARRAEGRLRPALLGSSWLVRSADAVMRSDVGAFGVRVRPEMAALMRGAAISTVAAEDPGEEVAPVFLWLPEDGEELPDTATFARSTTALTVNASLAFQSTAINTPRIWNLPNGDAGYISEPASTNLVTNSNNVTNASWTKANVTVTDLGNVAEIGLNVGNIDVGTSNAVHRWFGNSLATSGNHAASLLIKGGTGRYIINRIDGVSNVNYVVADLDSGTITENGSGLGRGVVRHIGNDWYMVTAIDNVSTNARPIISASNAPTPGLSELTFTGTNETYDVAHTQSEALSYATSPILTAGSSASRGRDTLTVSGVITAAPYSVYADVTFPPTVGPGATDDCPIFLLGATVTDRLTAYIDSTNVRIHLTTAGGISITKDIARATAEGARFKIAARLSENDAALSVSGQVIATDTTTGTIPTGNIGIGYGNTSRNFRGVIHQVAIYDSALTDEMLEVIVGNSTPDEGETFSDFTFFSDGTGWQD